MTDLAKRVLARHLLARQVKVLVDVPATLEARRKWPAFNEAVVGTFDESLVLYRAFDETELGHIVSSGRIMGGSYSVAPERAHGASWGHNIDNIVDMGNRLRGGRLGKHIYLAKIDGFDQRFLHLSPGIEFDPAGPPQQAARMDPARCNPGLGCSIFVDAADVEDFFKVDPDGQIHRMSAGELRDEARGQKAEEPPTSPPREDVRDPRWGLRPRDRFVVTKGSNKLGIQIRNHGMVKDVWQSARDLEVRDTRVFVTLAFTWPVRPATGRQTYVATLHATHPNRLEDPEIPLQDSRGNRILVRRR